MKINHLQRALLRCPLTSHQKITALALVHICDWQTWRCEASLKYLTKETGHPLSTLKRTLNQLIELGLIKRHRQGNEQGHTRSCYIICIDNLSTYLAEFIPLAQSGPTLAQSEPTLGPEWTYPLAQSGPTLGPERANPLAQSGPPYQPLISATNTATNSATNNGHNQPILDELGRPPKPDDVNPWRWCDWKNAWERADWLTNPTGEYKF